MGVPSFEGVVIDALEFARSKNVVNTNTCNGDICSKSLPLFIILLPLRGRADFIIPMDSPKESVLCLLSFILRVYSGKIRS